MTFTEWQTFEPEYGPPCPLACPDGIQSHVWQLTIEEGQTSVTTDECPICDRGMREHPPDAEMWEMRGIPARIEVHHERGYLCDDYSYVLITPTTTQETNP